MTTETFERFVLPEIGVLARVARSMTRHDADAEDLVQDTLVRAYRAIDRFDGRHPRAWLLTILRNTHVNRNRRRRPELLRDPELHDGAGGHAPAADAALDGGFDAAVERALAELSLPFRQVVELVDVNGLTYAEAARALGIAEGTVMSRLHRGRRRIRERLTSTAPTPAAATPAAARPAVATPAVATPAVATPAVDGATTAADGTMAGEGR